MYYAWTGWRWLSDSFPANETDIASGLDFKQYSLHHSVRVLRNVGTHCLCPYPRFGNAAFPLAFRRKVMPMTPERSS
jgi:hypothetical protein